MTRETQKPLPSGRAGHRALTGSRPLLAVVRWFDAWAGQEHLEREEVNRVDWARVVPFILLHVMCLGVLFVGWSGIAVAVAGLLYVGRMFAITGFYHRYFSHRAFKTSRACQLAFAVLGASAVQRGPLWWAAHHRNHHRYSDRAEDAHSPHQHSLVWSHMGWFTAPSNFATRLHLVRDFHRYPELRFLDRFDALVPVLLALGLYGLGAWLAVAAPELGTNGPQLLVWGFFVSTVALFHGTNTINSLAHRFGSRRYDTRDQSRNNFFLALVTMGEGWHNNHHHYPASARQGFFWWEVDLTYYGLVLLSWLGLVWDLRPVPAHVRDRRGERHGVPVASTTIDGAAGTVRGPFGDGRSPAASRGTEGHLACHSPRPGGVLAGGTEIGGRSRP